MSFHPADEVFSLQLDDSSTLQVDQEEAVPLTPRYSTFKKLEVVNSRRINFMAKVYNIVSFAALALTGLVSILSRVVFDQTYENVPVLLDDVTIKLLNLTIYIFPDYFTIIDFTLNLLVFAFAVFLLLIYAIVLFREGRHRILNEQAWVLMLLFFSGIYLFPYEAILRLRGVLGVAPEEEDGGFRSIDIFTCIRFSSFSIIYFLYFWMGSHSYRYLTERVSVRDWRFYTPKIVVTLTYILYKLCIFFRYRIVFSELPFASFVAFLNLYGRVGSWPRLGIIVISILTVMEIVMAGLLLHDVHKTFKLLKAAEYTKHRTKILGFRFFLHQQSVFNTVYICTYAFLLFGLPIGAQILQFFIVYHEEPGRGSYFDVQYAPFGLHLCVLAFITTEMYANLPANTNMKKVLFPKMFPLESENEPLLEPVVYRNTEPPSLTGRQELEIKPNCFVMQTNVELFNLAWYVYYHGTSKEKSLSMDFKDVNLKIRDSLYDEGTDTKAIVAELPDRIIVAFKGTTSTKNLQTDLKVNHHPLSSVVGRTEDPSPREQNRLLGRLNVKQMFRRARVHAGFANAYKTIKGGLMDVTAKLLQEKERPICFTGHSLGGALATLSSLDVQLSLDVPKKHVMVASFGSPRVGNDAFQELYDAEVPSHWRFVAGGDIISRLPKIGYRHVGRKVILTATGELFIDPSALEIIFWHSQTASIIHHRKACYLLALKAWCDQRADYIPKFWPFPVSENDSRKFDSTFRKPNTQSGTPQSRTSQTPRSRKRDKAEERVARIQRYAAAIDELEGPASLRSENERAIAGWKRLVTKALNSNPELNSSLSVDGPRTVNNEAGELLTRLEDSEM